MWLKTRMQPPVSGILSPSIQVRVVVASRVGFTIGTATLNAHPRFCCSFRTFTDAGYSVVRRARGDATSLDGAVPGPDRIVAMSAPGHVLLVPVKPPAHGKSRLLGVPDERRRELAAAFALDTVTTCLSTPGVTRVLAVTDDAL